MLPFVLHKGVVLTQGKMLLFDLNEIRRNNMAQLKVKEDFVHEIVDIDTIPVPYAGINTFNHYPYTRELEDVDIAIMGIPYDSGVTYRNGAKIGPRGLRDVSMSVFSFNHRWDTEDFSLAKACPNIIDYGDVGAYYGSLSTQVMFKESYEHAKRILESGANLMTLGGDHTIPYGMVRAASEVYGKLALLHFDSHQDSWPSHGNYSHANFAYDLWEEGCIDDRHSVQCYIRTDFDMEPGIPVPEYNIIFAPEALDLGPEALAEKIKSVIGDMPVYLTFDIDSIDPAFAPATGTPVIGGPTSNEALKVLRNLEGLNVVAGDIVCVAPTLDSPAQTTCFVGDAVVQSMMCLMAKARLARKNK